MPSPAMTMHCSPTRVIWTCTVAFWIVFYSWVD